jgi:hypothetical protein
MIMQLPDFAVLVRRMRDAQKEYFLERSIDHLGRAKALERDVDRAIVGILMSATASVVDAGNEPDCCK